MGKIFIIGTGPGSKEFLTPAAEKAVRKADILVGGRSSLNLFSNGKPKKTIRRNLSEVIGYIRDNRHKNIAVLTSGDPGFYSILGLIMKNFPAEDIEVVPGISSIQLCFARLKECWHDARFISLHGRGLEEIPLLRDEKIVILTDNNFPPNRVASYLLGRGLEGTAYVCDNLSHLSESVVVGSLEEISRAKFSGNCVMVVKLYSRREWEFRTPGVPESYFDREGSPITKEEVRVLTLSKARIKKDSIIWDIGSGTGSISVEAALLAEEGRVYSIERDPRRCQLIKNNIKKFKVPNVEVVEGEAPEVLESLPLVDRVIIGGSGGRIKEIIEYSANKLSSGGVIVVNAIKDETLREATDTFRELGFKFNITRVSVRRMVNGRTEDLNPVSIIDARRLEDATRRDC